MRLSEEMIDDVLYYTAKSSKHKPWPWKEIVPWCIQTYGPSAKGPGGPWYMNEIVTHGKLWFKEKDDFVFFILRWSSA